MRVTSFANQGSDGYGSIPAPQLAAISTLREANPTTTPKKIGPIPASARVVKLTSAVDVVIGLGNESAPFSELTADGDILYARSVEFRAHDGSADKYLWVRTA